MDTIESSLVVRKSITINAPASKVWKVLTDLDLMKQWVLNTEVEVLTDWQVGNPIVIRWKLEKGRFENKGTVLQFEPEKVLEYNYWTKISRLPDKPENYARLKLILLPDGKTTTLELINTNIAAVATVEHSNFYWNSTLGIIKKLAESDELK